MSQPAKPFRLDAVLNYRKLLVDIAQQRLYEAQKVRSKIAQKLDDEQQACSLLIGESERLQAEGISISLLIRYDERISFLQQSIKAIRKTLAEKDAIVLTEQSNLARCNQDRQVMERLKERQNKSWNEYQDKRERSILDEIAVIRHEGSHL